MLIILRYLPTRKSYILSTFYSLIQICSLTNIPVSYFSKFLRNSESIAMDRRVKRPTEDDGSIQVQIMETKQPSDNWGSPTIFTPQQASTDPMERKESSNADVTSLERPTVPAPEKKLTLFALRLAILEKMASGLGTLGFIWATVVLLGGFAITLDKTDFWFITIILLIEGTRIFSRSHELEWQHQATWSIADAGISSFRAIRSSSHFLVEAVKSIFCRISTIRTQSHPDRELTHSIHIAEIASRNYQKSPTRTWTTSDVPLFPYAQWVFLSRNISKLLYWLQLLSASACITLSLIKLIKQNYGDVSKGDSDKRNRNSALNMFYGLAFAEATLFLMEKVYWEWKVIFCKLLQEVTKECEFGLDDMVSVKRFFYDAYSRCVNGSIFDGLKMDLVSFGMELLCSASCDEQLIGARILTKLATSQHFSEDTLQKIGTCMAVMERLVEMLNWKDPQQEEIRRAAAEILSKLAGTKQNSLRVAGIPGALESISSLLYTDRNSNVTSDEISQKNVVCDQENYEYSAFNHLGLHILKKLATDHDNCGKIGNTRGLLPKIIDFTHAGERLLKNDHVTESQVMTIKRSLQLVKMLASTTGSTGRILRQEISEIVFTVSNIREILHYGEKHPMLQKLAIEILTSLALEEEATERIGSTGGILKELFHVFFKQGMPENHNHVRVVAGEALAMLAFDSERNCYRILKLEVVGKLIVALDDRVLRVNSARILRNLCTFVGSECFLKLKEVTSAAPTVLQAIMSEKNKLQEVMLGLASQIFRFMTPQESSNMLELVGVKENNLAMKLVQVMKDYEYPPVNVPRIRRFAIELAIWMMRDKKSNIRVFKDLGMEQELEGVLETTSELESFNVFSGTIGLSRHNTSIHSLVETALNLLAEG